MVAKFTLINTPITLMALALFIASMALMECRHCKNSECPILSVRQTGENKYFTTFVFGHVEATRTAPVEYLVNSTVTCFAHTVVKYGSKTSSGSSTTSYFLGHSNTELFAHTYPALFAFTVIFTLVACLSNLCFACEYAPRGEYKEGSCSGIQYPLMGIVQLVFFLTIIIMGTYNPGI